MNENIGYHNLSNKRPIFQQNASMKTIQNSKRISSIQNFSKNKNLSMIIGLEHRLSENGLTVSFVDYSVYNFSLALH